MQYITIFSYTAKAGHIFSKCCFKLRPVCTSTQIWIGATSILSALRMWFLLNWIEVDWKWVDLIHIRMGGGLKWIKVDWCEIIGGCG